MGGIQPKHFLLPSSGLDVGQNHLPRWGRPDLQNERSDARSAGKSPRVRDLAELADYPELFLAGRAARKYNTASPEKGGVSECRPSGTEMVPVPATWLVEGSNHSNVYVPASRFKVNAPDAG
jgi:hypothetical protein